MVFCFLARALNSAFRYRKNRVVSQTIQENNPVLSMLNACLASQDLKSTLVCVSQCE